MLSAWLLLALAQTPDAGALEPSFESESPVHVAAGLESEVGVLPSGWRENGLDVFVGFRPMVALVVDEVVAIHLGPLVRLRLLDTPPFDRSTDRGHLVRGEDWDRPGDLGELLQALRLGADQSPVQLRAGPIHKKTLGSGHLLFRYSNRLNADARPAAATASLSVAFLKAEVFASDVLAARLFAGELTWDVGRTLSPESGVQGRYLISLSAAHDAAMGTPATPRSGCSAEVSCPQVAGPPRVTFVHLDGSAAVIREKAISLALLGGFGARADTSRDLGFVVGAAADFRLGHLEWSLRLEGRKQNGGFRHGFFGPQYEIARFVGTGLSLSPLAHERLPDGFSVFGESRVRLARAVSLDGAVEHFTFGRMDFDVTAAVEVLGRHLVAEARVGAVGLGQTPRWLLSAGFRFRVLPSMYVMASGGTAFFPNTDGTLSRGLFAAAGVGVDVER
jgi:hypothetical protein